MSEKYSFKTIEKKWQKYWQEFGIFNLKKDSKKEKFYCLVMFPYPSGVLHLGHVRNYSIGDAIAWYKRLCGFEVIHPIGWDSFGQPAEQAAIKNKVQPKEWTEKNIEHMRNQLKRLGFSYDWAMELSTHKSEYYVWNQWFFLQMFRKGLVYKKYSFVNWCPKEETVLSNEQSVDGKCWRCKTDVLQKEMNQWFIKTTAYVDELVRDLEVLEHQRWPSHVLKMQKNWIGRLEEVTSTDERKITYKLHDWGISRQRFWGTPIPVIYCEECGTVPVPEKDLPVLLPDTVEITGVGNSPLEKIPEFVKTNCPKCNKEAKRETDTMDTFVDSSWYYFRYCDSKNSVKVFDEEKIKAYLPVDLYIGGVEHAVMHLLYTRFWNKMMRDLGLISFDEPIKKLVTQGMVLNKTHSCLKPDFWQVMSKSLGNGVDPDQLIEKYGVDAVRMFILFVAPTEDELRWREEGISGIVRFFARVYNLINKWQEQTKIVFDESSQQVGTPNVGKIIQTTNQAINRVTQSVERMHFNFCISSLMEFVNDLSKIMSLNNLEIFTMKEALDTLILLMSPFAPHFAEECWEKLGHQKCILQSEKFWPKPKDIFIEKENIIIPVQINGKLFMKVEVGKNIPKEQVKALVFENEKLKQKIMDQKIVDIIIVSGRIINIVLQN